MAPGRRRNIPRATQSAQSEPILPTVSLDTNSLLSSVASTSTRKGLGRSKNLALQNALSANSGQRIKIVIPPDLKEPVGKWDKMFKAELGIIIKMNPPIAASSSDEVPEQVVSAWHTRIKVLDTSSTNIIKRPRILEATHRLACQRRNANCVATDSRALSVQNSTSRAQLTIESQSQVQSKSQEPDSQGPMTNIMLYKKTHYNRKTGQWTCPEAKANHEEMERIRAEPTPKGSFPPTDKEIYELVLGRRPEYFRGLGHGVVPISSRYSSHLTCEAKVREANERIYQALREATEARVALEVSLQEQQQQNAEVRSLIKSLREQRGLI